MRIVGGKYKGRQLRLPGNLPVRPTTNFAKESIFNIINHQFVFEELTILDLFCGTGNISIEFISRGVQQVQAVDSNFNCIKFLKKTAAELQIDNLNAVKSNAYQYIEKTVQQFDIIFADPPYDDEKLNSIPDLIFDQQLIKKDGWLILEHGPRKDFSQHPCFHQHRKYGHVNFSIFKQQDQ